MASESSSLSQSSLTIKDEFEVLEVQEFDANALWELLSDEPGEVGIGGDGPGPGPMHEMEMVSGPYPDLGVEGYGFLEGVDWLHMMDETCNDMYVGPCMDMDMEDMNDILAMRDYSFAHNAIMSDEIGYIGLWQDN